MASPAGSLQACLKPPVTSAMGQQTAMNAHDFENHVLKRLTALRPGWTVKKGPEPFQLTIRRVRETDLRFNLDSFYQQYREQPSALDRLFAARLRRLDQECDSEALFGAPLILPVLRPASFLDSAGGPVVYRRMLTDMVVTYAAHYAQGMRYLLPQDLAAWNVGRDHVEVIALTNLALMFRNGMKFTGLETDKNGRPRMLMLSYVDPRPYGAALMLLPEVWAWLEEMLEDIPVVGVPERGSLIAAGQQAQLLGRLRHDVQERHREAAIPVSNHLFCVENGRIRQYAR
ncbi:MAG: hypothetical protein E6I99_01260 [Chloroflexi bacterium]|nr:MAG: hypothetical protein E6I99_01260 [Chloroflexota bacterium]TMD84762.1 MAG: hypothetical protein E6I74_01860 [Chloroflexota bacterium]